MPWQNTKLSLLVSPSGKKVHVMQRLKTGYLQPTPSVSPLCTAQQFLDTAAISRGTRLLALCYRALSAARLRVRSPSHVSLYLVRSLTHLSLYARTGAQTQQAK